MKMKKWIKPELYIEDFELSQHVAAGCGTKTEIIVKPGGFITVGVGCASSYSGQGHWHTDMKIEDTNNNGKIDWSEVVEQVGAADNGVVTGSGHRNHQSSIYLPGGEEIQVIEKPFSS